MAREYRKCPQCGEYRHDLMYPWLDPDATTPDPRRRTINPEPAATYARRSAKAEAAHAERLIAVRQLRRAAQAKGRDYSACLPCQNGDTA